MSNDAKSDSQLSEILEQNHTIAVVGIKDREGEDAYRIPKYMQEHGYTIVPVNPKLERVLGEKAYASLRELDDDVHVDVVNLFRATDHVPDHVEEILSMKPLPRVVWLQLGIHDGPSAARMRAEGITVIQDRCIKVDHARLLGPDAPPASSPAG
jgi:predicted CoA-binding protein